MVKVLRSRYYFYYFIFFFLLNTFLAKEKYSTFDIEILPTENDLDYFYINIGDTDTQNDDDTKCEKWVPSLLSPILLVGRRIILPNIKEIDRGDIYMHFPVISDETFLIHLFSMNLYKNFNLTLGKNSKGSSIDKCYFGLSTMFGDFSNIYENDTNLYTLVKNSEINQEIFSFDNWTINKNSIKTSLYLGDEHEKFINNEGIIGRCNSNKSDLYWGCSFKKMAFNDNTETLDYEGNYYKIYFSSENYKIIFPETFKSKFDKITNNSCENDVSGKITCKNIFNSDHYFQLKLINDDMIITIEIDDLYRFISNEDGNHKTRIEFQKNNYFILPLIMFKKFHIQFDSKKNIISFYTNDKSILELIEKKEDNPSNNEDNNNSSNAGTVILVIFIILLFLCLIIAIIWFIRKRKGSSEKNINKYNKFEDEDNFKDMNEKRVF